MQQPYNIPNINTTTKASTLSPKSRIEKVENEIMTFQDEAKCPWLKMATIIAANGWNTDLIGKKERNEACLEMMEKLSDEQVS